MSDYVREKVLRYPIEPEQLGVEELYDLEFNEKYRELFNCKKHGYFSIAPTTQNFIDYVLSHTYGEDSGDFGKVRELYANEKEKYKPIFQRLIPDVDMDKVRLVDYCWYNCCEAPDYYDLTPQYDNFYDEV